MHACSGALQLHPRAVVLRAQSFNLCLQLAQTTLRAVHQHVLRAQLRFDVLDFLCTRQHACLLGFSHVKTHTVACQLMTFGRDQYRALNQLLAQSIRIVQGIRNVHMTQPVGQQLTQRGIIGFNQLQQWT